MLLVLQGQYHFELALRPVWSYKQIVIAVLGAEVWPLILAPSLIHGDISGDRSEGWWTGIMQAAYSIFHNWRGVCWLELNRPYRASGL